MASASRCYYYPIRDPCNSQRIRLTEITEEEYRVLYPEIWRTRMREQKLGHCICPARLMWKCDSDCMICSYHIVKASCPFDLVNQLLDECDPADIVTDKLLLQQLLSRLEELYPEALDVGKCKLSGLSERQAVKALGIIRTSYRRRLRKAQSQLSEEFNEYFDYSPRKRSK